jgi:hypothetical protein
MRTRLLIGALMLVAALVLLPQFLPDYAQDYAAARAWWQGRDTNTRTAVILAECCAEIAPLYGGMQTAHPPFATLLALPFAWLPWPYPRWIWLAISWASIVGAWQLGKVSTATCAATAPFWIIALGLGTHEPLLFLLLMLALRYDKLRPDVAGALVGLCAAIKVYPIVLIGGLVIARRFRPALAALAVGMAALVICELMLGFGVTIGWLRFVPTNTNFYVDQIDNGSLVRLIRAVLPTVSPSIATLVILVLLTLPLIPRLRQGDWLRPLVTVMLLSSPLSWRHYMGLAALDTLGVLEQIALATAGGLALLIGMGVVPPDNMAPLVQSPLLLVLIWRWYRAARPSSKGQPAQEAEW